MKLTAQNVEKMQPTDRRQEIPDDLCTGLYLTVQPTGRKGWQVRYRHSGKHRRMTLGAYPVLSLAQARQRAREVMAATAEGRDPAEEVREAKAPKPEQDRDTVRALAALYDKRHLSKLRSGKLVRRELDRHVVAVWGARNVQDITKRDILDLLDGIADTGREVTANRVRAYLSGFLNWCVGRDILPLSPMTGVKAVAKEVSRDRVLSDDEIRWLWQAADRVGYPWGPVAKVLLLTGQRVGEVAAMTRDELDGDTWHLPGSRVKNGQAHDVPLSPEVRAILDGLPQIGDQYLFTTTGHGPVQGNHKARNALAEAMAGIAGQEVPHWTFHDLRRTCAATLAKLRVPVVVTEAVLNHVSGTRGGIVAVYQVHDYADEKREALEAWGKYVTSLVTGRADNVIRIGEAASKALPP